MGYVDRFSDDYAEEIVVIDDPERIRAFLGDLEVAKSAEEALEPQEVDDDTTVTATYELEHPYRGEAFSHALLHDEEVVARVQVEADVSDSYKDDYLFSGTVRDSAYDIFRPPEVEDGSVDTGEDAAAASNDPGVATD
ncbi:MAG: hypothetical protein ABEJ98_00295 [Candidatus Nanohaloarchaea archaeon]